ncbi:MAG: hypothetical protein KGO02_17885 [Alphaproteobacteria bacterium]|nr:hypothetical protein [Alphaproteobacteria bacterium]
MNWPTALKLINLGVQGDVVLLGLDAMDFRAQGRILPFDLGGAAVVGGLRKRTIGSRNKEGRRERRKRKAGQQRIGHQTPPVIIAINCRQAPSDGIL